MNYSPISIANAFLAMAKGENRPLTNMQLQKLVYFAHGWHLAIKDQPLLDTPVKAWNFGPVIPPLYNALKKFGNGDVAGPIGKGENEVMPTGDFIKRLLRRVWVVYGKLSGSKLSALTHEPGSPWERVYNSTPFEPIPDELIAAYFKEQRKA